MRKLRFRVPGLPSLPWRKLVGYLVALVTAVLIAVTNPVPAAACSCYMGPLSEFAEEVGTAFVGRQTHRIEGDRSGMAFGRSVVLVMDVSRVYKGQVGPRVAVLTNSQESACGVDFTDEPSRGVVAFGQDGDLGVDLCSAWAWNTGDIEEVFGRGYPPDETIELALPANADLTVKEFEAALGIVPTLPNGESGEGDGIPASLQISGLALGILLFMALMEWGLAKGRQ